MAKKPLPVRAHVAALLATGTKQEIIAQALSISPRTVSRIAGEVKPAILEADRKLALIQKTLAVRMPPDARANGLVDLFEVAKATKQPSAGLACIQEMNKLDDIITKGDQLRYANGDEHARKTLVPMFSLPPGSRIAIQVGNPAPEPPTTDSGQASQHNSRYVTSTDSTTTCSDTMTDDKKDI